VRAIQKEHGYTLVDLLFVCALIGVLSVMALPNLLQAKQAAGSASAIGSLRNINSAQLTFALTCGGGFYAPKLSTLGVPPIASKEAFLSPNLTAADTIVKSGYTIQLLGTAYAGAPASCNGLPAGDAAQAFKAGADPVNSAHNTRFFGTNANGQLYEHTSTLFAGMPQQGIPAIGHVLY
jgi:type II secretory pathway pseudopilin PulG